MSRRLDIGLRASGRSIVLADDDVSAAPAAADLTEAMVHHALAYARRGWPVFPCNPRPGSDAKKPLTTHSFKDATTDEAQIRRWWKKAPNALIGAPMGARTGVLALDPDALEPGKPDGVRNWNALLNENGGIPLTRCHLTPGGGMHFLFAYPTDRKVGIKEGKLAGKGIHVRGEGGYVILPPSRLDDGLSYRLADPAHEWTLAPAPEWLLDLIAERLQADPQGLGALPAHLAAAAPNGIVLREFARPKPRAVAEVCQSFVRMMQDAPTAGEKVWWKTCELAMHTTGGAELAHALASKHPQYTLAETQKRIDRHMMGGFGPPTCATLQGLYGDASPCPSCPHYGNPTTSPVAIARREADHVVPAGDGSGRQCPKIIVEGGEISITADKALDALLASGLPIYQRSGRLVRPVMDEVPASRGRTTIVARLAEINVHAVMDMLARAIEFQRFDARRGKHVRIDPPRAVAEIMLSREGSWPFPRVAGCVTAPTLRADGSLLQAAGYDAASRLYHHRDPGLVLPAMAEAPTPADAEGALALLDSLLDGFPFVAPLDRAVALSLLMTAVLRGGMSVAPLHLVRSHTPGTGKSFLVDLAATIATGRRCPVSSVGPGAEELEKRITALLLHGSPLASLDNVNGEVGGDVLCQAVERPLISVRPLGVSEMREVECRAAVFATGNNVIVRGDMVRRTLTCNLDAGMERPETRRFKSNPIERAESDRGRYFTAVLTIARAYRAAGCPAVCPPLGSYDDYTSAVRAPLAWLGIEDPAASMEEARAEDPELASIRELFGHLEAAPGLKPDAFYKAKHIEQAAFQHPDFWDFLLQQCGIGGTVNSKALSRFLARIHGRVVDGRKLVRRPDREHGHLYALMQAGAVG